MSHCFSIKSITLCKDAFIDNENYSYLFVLKSIHTAYNIAMDGDCNVCSQRFSVVGNFFCNVLCCWLCAIQIVVLNSI